jgi:hypothetical protein
MVFIEPILEKNRGKVTAAQEQELKFKLIRDFLSQYIKIKALYLEFFRDMLGKKTPKEFEEMKAKVTKKAAQIFHDKQIPMLLKKYEVDNLDALEHKLREKSMSIHTLRKQFAERVLSSELERKYVPENQEFSRDELLTYYHAHEADWNIPSRAKWRELCVLFSNHSRKEAKALIADLGNQVDLGGKSFEVVAKKQSEGSTAAEGGIFDWTIQGSLQSAAINQVIFSVPLKRLCGAIESDVGFHIIEVLEREPGYKKTFESAEHEILRKLTEEKRNHLLADFRAKIIAQTKIWTLWPEDIPNSQPLAERPTD